jgi:hypothetical protein
MARKETSYHYYNLLNKERISGTDNDFVVSEPKIKNCLYFKINRLYFENLIYNIDNTNNEFNMSVGAGWKTKLIDHGSYSGLSICAYLQEWANSVAAGLGGAGTFTFVYSLQTGKITITRVVGDFSIWWKSNSPYQEMGFNVDNADPGFPRYHATQSIRPVDFSYPSHLVIKSRSLTSSSSSQIETSNKAGNVLLKVPVTNPFMTAADMWLEKRFNIIPNFHGDIDIRVEDSTGALMDLNGGRIGLEMMFSNEEIGII